MIDTIGSMKAAISERLMGERVSDTLITGCINDGIEALWMELILSNLSIMMGGPVGITINAGDEGVILVTIADPSAGPVVTAVSASDPSNPGHTVSCAYTYVTESGSETNISPATGLTLIDGLVASIHAPPIASGAYGWNAYAVGISGTGGFIKQNDAPLDWSAPFNEQDAGFVSFPNGPVPPTSNSTGDNIFQIRHLETKLTSGIYKSYNGADLDSTYMRRMAGYIATNSEYQDYAWDLINQRQLEIRPAAGSTLNPRFFYIVKPRRSKFDDSPLPFPNVPQTEYIRSYSLAEIFLSLHEYDASNAWEVRAEKALMKAKRAVTSMNSNINESVTPYLYGGGFGNS